jgi:hypothetical protein
MTCETPSTTPTTKTPTASTIVRFLSRGTPESSRRLVATLCAAVLCGLSISLAEALSYQAHRNWPVSAAVATAFGAVVGFIAALAREIFRTPEKPESATDPNEKENP